MSANKLTAKQRAFVDEYLIDLNATQAAIRTGYSAKTAEVQGCRLLSIAKIKAAVSEAMQARSERTQIDAAWVLTELQKQYNKADAAAETNVALNALNLMGKHTDVGAYLERTKTETSVTITEIERVIVDSGGKSPL